MATSRLVGGAVAAMLAAVGGVVAHHEGVIPYTYADPIVGIPTACAGETGRHIRFGQTYTTAECWQMLDRRLALEWSRLERCITAPLQMHQAVAVLSWSYNVGTGAACGSTLVRKLNAGRPPHEWCAELTRWVYAGGKPVRGLIRRRAAERAMCEGRA